MGENEVTFTTAQDSCREKYGTDLASVHSKKELNDAITSVPDGYSNSFWVDLDRMDGSEDSGNWSSRANGNSLENREGTNEEQCVALTISSMNVVDCNEKHAFLCNFPTTSTTMEP